VTQDEQRILDSLQYDPSGRLLWKQGWRIGLPAGSLNSDGRRRIQIGTKQYKEHRLVWFLHHKVWPQYGLDHINGDPTDNRIENLRDVPQQINSLNRRGPQRNSRSGILGVCRVHATGRWQVRYGKIRVGTYWCLGLAYQARRRVERGDATRGGAGTSLLTQKETS
jgi:HNH endonuclease